MLKLLLLMLFLAPAAFAQADDLPVFGELSEIKGKQRFYAAADDAKALREIQKVLSGSDALGLQAVKDPDTADFLVEYRIVSRTTKFLGGTERGTMTAYYIRDGRRVVVWSDAVTGGGYKADTARRLARKLVSALRKNK